MYGAADWGLRALGINWTYWESQIGVHVVLSVLPPVAITNLLFPRLRDQSYLRTGGFIVTGALAVAGVLGLRVVISATEDPGNQTPWGWTVAYLLMIARRWPGRPCACCPGAGRRTGSGATGGPHGPSWSASSRGI
ncbi:hypothetical protein [Nonomuraea sp. NPDC049607]|uniref:hypothetical protein n=1 Tax=Nonomuraea sp. NPDC049607 TaxID=3154732 RepID=UPI00341E32C5